MGGKFARSKGRRNEQQLVLQLAIWGYKAERILRQYLAPGEADVKASKNGKDYTFEMKSRRCSFKSVYEVYYKDRDTDGLLCFVLNSGGVAVAISNDVRQLHNVGRSFRNLTLFPPDKKLLKNYNRLITIKKMKQAADFLVIKDNNQPRLFIRYWESI